jgi:hypothetical protein
VYAIIPTITTTTTTTNNKLKTTVLLPQQYLQLEFHIRNKATVPLQLEEGRDRSGIGLLAPSDVYRETLGIAVTRVPINHVSVKSL